MAVSFESALNSWLGSLGKLEKRELDGMHLGVLASFRFVKLDVHFILAALEAWDPNHHMSYALGIMRYVPSLKSLVPYWGGPLCRSHACLVLKNTFS